MTSRFDAWLTNDEPWLAPQDEYDPPCRECGHSYHDHPVVIVPATDTTWAYERTVCPPPLGFGPKAQSFAFTIGASWIVFTCLVIIIGILR